MARVQFKTNIEKTLQEELKICAAKERLNMNDVIEDLLEQLFKGEIELKYSKKK